MADYIDKKTVQAIVESAGRTMLLLPANNTRPRGYVSCMPEIIREFEDLIAAPKLNSDIMIRASMRQMNELETVILWLTALGVHCKQKNMSYVARTVALGMLHNPRTDRRLLSWRLLGERMHVSHHTAKKWYEDGISIIATQENQRRVLRNFQHTQKKVEKIA